MAKEKELNWLYETSMAEASGNIKACDSDDNGDDDDDRNDENDETSDAEPDIGIRYSCRSTPEILHTMCKSGP